MQLKQSSLIISNTFMTIAWYGHLKYKKAPTDRGSRIRFLAGLMAV
jgi:uncharacterized protein (DUF486 family)